MSTPAVVSSTPSERLRKVNAWNCAVYQTTACPATRPNSAINTQRSWDQRPKASRSGARESEPASCIARNTGLSARPRRIQPPMPSSTMDSRKGTRQPQSANTASPSSVRVARMTTSDSSRPRVAVVCSQPVAAPMRPGGACSATKVAAPPYSPPSARPCIRRSATSSTGAATPIESAPGTRPIVKVARPITSMVTRNVCLRPMVSPMWPNSSAPKGRTTKPAANAASAKPKALAGSSPVKNCLPRMAASVQYR